MDLWRLPERSPRLWEWLGSPRRGDGAGRAWQVTPVAQPVCDEPHQRDERQAQEHGGDDEQGVHQLGHGRGRGYRAGNRHH
jgi:hypothetical protein